MGKTGKKLYPAFTLMRCLGAFLVILVHVSAYGFYIASEHLLTSIIYNGMGRSAVPLFFMISGALMIGREESIRDWALKGLRKVLFPYCFWASAFLIFVMLSENRRDVSLNIFQTAPYYHLPFMLHYISYYLALPLLRGFWTHPRVRKSTKQYVVAASLGFMVITDWLPQFLGQSVLGMTLITGQQYTAYALLGAYLWENRTDSTMKNDGDAVTRSKRRTPLLWLLLSLAGMGLTVTCTWITTTRLQSPSDVFFIYSSPFILMSAAGLFLFFRDLELSNLRHIRWLESAAAHTFRVYFIHPMLLTLLIRSAHISWNSFYPPVWIPVLSLLLFLLSLLLSAIIDRLSPSRWSEPSHRQRRIILSALCLILVFSAVLLLKHVEGLLPDKSASVVIIEETPAETSDAMYHSFDQCDIQENSLLIKGWAIEVGTDSQEASVFLEFRGDGGDLVYFSTTPYFSTYLRDLLDPGGAYDWAFFESSIPLSELKSDSYTVSILVKGKGFWRSAAKYTVDLSR